MSHLDDSIDWQAIRDTDTWLDDNAGTVYLYQPLAQDWARVTKVYEEAGEAVAALIGLTGQNPRKGYTHCAQDVIDELADTAITAMLAIQHFTKDRLVTRRALQNKIKTIEKRTCQ